MYRKESVDFRDFLDQSFGCMFGRTQYYTLDEIDLDSLDQIKIIMWLEDYLRVEIDDADVELISFKMKNWTPEELIYRVKNAVYV